MLYVDCRFFYKMCIAHYVYFTQFFSLTFYLAANNRSAKRSGNLQTGLLVGGKVPIPSSRERVPTMSTSRGKVPIVYSGKLQSRTPNEANLGIFRRNPWRVT